MPDFGPKLCQVWGKTFPVEELYSSSDSGDGVVVSNGSGLVWAACLTQVRSCDYPVEAYGVSLW